MDNRQAPTPPRLDEGEVLLELQAQEGWTDATALALLLQYIKNQQNPEAFRDFLLEKTAPLDDDGP